MRLTSERLVLRHLSLSMGLASVGRPTQDTPGQSSGSGPVSLVSFGGNWKFKPFLVAVDPRLAKQTRSAKTFRRYWKTIGERSKRVQNVAENEDTTFQNKRKINVRFAKKVEKQTNNHKNKNTALGLSSSMTSQQSMPKSRGIQQAGRAHTTDATDATCNSTYKEFWNLTRSMGQAVHAHSVSPSLYTTAQQWTHAAQEGVG